MTKQLTVTDQIIQTLDTPSMREKLEVALPPDVPLEKFMSVAKAAILTTPGIENLDRSSVYMACLEAAQMGLLPNKVEGAIVPHKGRATFRPMVKGKINIANATLNTVLVHENDQFDLTFHQDGFDLKHKPVLWGDKGKAMGVYCLAQLKDGTKQIEIMNVDEINKVRESSQVKNGGPWRDWWDEMAKKTVIHRMVKRLPQAKREDAIEARDESVSFLKRPAFTHQNTPSRIEQIVEVSESKGEEIL